MVAIKVQAARPTVATRVLVQAVRPTVAIPVPAQAVRPTVALLRAAAFHTVAARPLVARRAAAGPSVAACARACPAAQSAVISRNTRAAPRNR